MAAGSLEHTAGMTWLGTEYFNGPLGMPPKEKSEFSGTCLPSRYGMNDTDPIRMRIGGIVRPGPAGRGGLENAIAP